VTATPSHEPLSFSSYFTTGCLSPIISPWLQCSRGLLAVDFALQWNPWLTSFCCLLTNELGLFKRKYRTYWKLFLLKYINAKVIGRAVPRNNYLRCLLIFISPLHVSVPTGHLKAEYTIISGKLPHYSGSVVLCYKSYFVYGLANTAVVHLNVTVRYPAWIKSKYCAFRLKMASEGRNM
jgi:hypothetical protein